MSCPNSCAIAKRDRRIVIERLKSNAAENSFNEIDERDDSNWETYATRWAWCKTAGGMEAKRSGQVQAERKHDFGMPYDSTLAAATSEMRVSFNSRKFHIEHVENVDEANLEIILHCKEKA